MAVLKVTFTKYKRNKLAQILWLLNWLSVMTGVILFSLGLLLKVEIKKRIEVLAKGEISSASNMLMSVGLIACVINFLGGKICYDCSDVHRYRRWRLVLLPYIAFAFCFTFCLLVSAFMCYTTRKELEESLYLGLREAVRFYKDTDIPGRCFLKKAIDVLQIQFQCCGNSSFRDWFEIQWISARYLNMASREVVDRLKNNIDGKFLVDGVPFSCCNPNSPRPCIQHQLTNNTAHYNYDFLTEELNVWMRGCREALLDYYTHLMRSIGLVVLIIWLFELCVLIGVRYLQTALKNVPLDEPELDSDGWLLENSFVETVKYNLNFIKNLRKADQVSTVSELPNLNKDI
ncbi:photoreceptor outer segment membrane glycoprotein 2-like [Trichosurus vulpecula]|uniref:photoreceptor outer segment membrane glycoprotein 2-like n=1 Tax=Trichosurus vulpecula TaxID=9337 RepID=UPI00186B37A5|nr:photoreceptor outer segment membrane glycoprotein 2-like [Trichosurus vulpecula]